MPLAPLVLAAAASITQVPSFGSNPAGLNMYTYVPATPPAADAPLVLVMHGCTQGASDAATFGWNALADANGFYVVYPEETTANNPMRCFNWAGVYGDPTNLERGKGENLSIKQMVDYMESTYAIDAKRVFVVGFSAGAAEALLMLATWPDVFAAGAALSGVPYDCGSSVSEATSCMNPGKDQAAKAWGDLVRNAYPGYAGPWPRVSLWHGTKDSIVNFMNLSEEIKQWTDVHGVADTPTSSDTVGGFPHHEFAGSNGAVIESFEITGMDHGVPVDPSNGCGTAGAYVLDEKVCAAAHIAEFFGIASGSGSSGGGSGSGSSGGGSGSGSGGASGSGSGGVGGSGSGGVGGSGSGGSSSSGASSGSGSGGSSGAAGTSNAASSGGAASAAPEPTDSVCACRAAGKRSEDGGLAIAAFAIGAAGISARRRRTRGGARS